jgi:hypothetical protein
MRRCQEISLPTGIHLRTFGERGNGIGQLTMPFDVHATPGHVIIADTFNDRVTLWTATGEWLGYVGHHGMLRATVPSQPSDRGHFTFQFRGIGCNRNRPRTTVAAAPCPCFARCTSSDCCSAVSATRFGICVGHGSIPGLVVSSTSPRSLRRPPQRYVAAVRACARA